MTELLAIGTGAYNRLGLGDNRDQRVPAPVTTAVVSAAGGLYHSGAVSADGELFLFGSDATRCIGRTGVESDDEDETDNSRPVLVRSFPKPVEISQVAVGGDMLTAHTLALTRTGRVYAWGDGRCCGIGPVKGPVDRPSPVRDFLSGEGGNIESKKVKFVSAGGSASALITTDGSVYTFGITAGGRLGYRTNKLVQWIPRRVDLREDARVKAVAVGGSHMMAVTSRGSLFVWGDNGKGQLGLGSLSDRTSPVRVPHPTGLHWSPVLAAGEGHSLCVDSAGQLFAWGACGMAALGRGGIDQMTDRRSEQERMIISSFDISGLSGGWLRPQPVASLVDHRIAQVSAGAGHSIALTIDGVIFVWGSRAQTPVALGPVSVPRVLSLPLRRTVGVAAGSYHSFIVASPVTHPGFQFLVDTAHVKSASHDCFVISSDGSPVWLSAVAMGTRMSQIGWQTVFAPQIKSEASPAVNRQADHSDDASPVYSSLSQMAASFHTSKKTKRRAIEEYERIGSILDDWVASTAANSDDEGDSGLPKIPSDLRFENLDRNFISVLVDLILNENIKTGEIDNSSLSSLNQLLSILRLPKLGDRGTQIPDSTIPQSVEYLYSKARREGDIDFMCSESIHREMQNKPIKVHSFIIESQCTEILLLSGSDGDISPARRRGALTIVAGESRRFSLSLPEIPVDVFHEIVYFLYFGKFDESSADFEDAFDDDSGRVVKFWEQVAVGASVIGNLKCQNLAIDRILNYLNPSNCIQILLISESLPFNCKQLREPALLTGSRTIAEDILTSPIFQPTGLLQDAEELIDRFMSDNENLVSLKRKRVKLFDEMRGIILSRIAFQLSIAGAIKIKCDHLGSNLDQEVPKSLIGSAMTPIRGEPSLVKTVTDMVGGIGIISLTGVIMSLTPSIYKNYPNSQIFKMFIISLNFVLLSFSILILFRGFYRK
jgi:alpha-tubulin suppressor-like RCC1 family protein